MRGVPITIDRDGVGKRASPYRYCVQDFFVPPIE